MVEAIPDRRITAEIREIRTKVFSSGSLRKLGDIYGVTIYEMGEISEALFLEGLNKNQIFGLLSDKNGRPDTHNSGKREGRLKERGWGTVAGKRGSRRKWY